MRSIQLPCLIVHLLLWRFRQLLLPYIVRLGLIETREHEVKDFRIPLYWLALDALLDVLQ